ncbi:MAG: hypothetical protein IPH13_20765 [Planctomycetes bacterium]|nr:hypothetical protein [Planctomycetota bacterium]
MRIGPDETVWIVTDPERGSDSAGTVMETTLRDLRGDLHGRRRVLHEPHAPYEAGWGGSRRGAKAFRRAERQARRIGAHDRGVDVDASISLSFPATLLHMTSETEVLHMPTINATRLGPHDQFWLVTDATLESVLADVLTRTTLSRFALMLRGGLSMDEHPTIFLDRADAIEEAGKRLAASAADFESEPARDAATE